jgi:hypothetical protein
MYDKMRNVEHIHIKTMSFRPSSCSLPAQKVNWREVTSPMINYFQNNLMI